MAHTDYGTDTRIQKGSGGVGEWGSRGAGERGRARKIWQWRSDGTFF
ncbi:MAG: hypothetical protein SWX82_00430 [Cyanobacteriota bacterium]|nr:hypothetical protein [Cyanobacteriota bacterium]